ncbi:GAF domain-containing protein [Streptomyces sp. MS1.AVA.1]|uniref:GAF domain-containing protein n=1 Tax=Streptomyces machairae TaxID=3134109 RepID=A0ABU8UVS9_9ACTN
MVNVDHPGWKVKVKEAFLSLETTIFLAVGSAALGPGIANTHGAIKVFLCVLLAFAAGLLAWSASIRQRWLGGFTEAAEHVSRRVAGSGHPVLTALKRSCLDQGTAQHTSPEEVRGQVLEAARKICGKRNRDENRATFFEVRGFDLVYADSRGRTPSTPRERWRGRAPSAEKPVVDWAKVTRNVRPDRVGDVSRPNSTRGPVDTQATYKSYISIPVVSGPTSFGMLTVDSPELQNFNEIDEDTIALLAHILAAAMAHQATVANELMRVKAND